MEVIALESEGEKKYKVVQYKKAKLPNGTLVDVVDDQITDIFRRSDLLVEITKAKEAVKLLQDRLDAIDALEVK